MDAALKRDSATACAILSEHIRLGAGAVRERMGRTLAR
jgi:hypothetical protein